MFGVNKEYVDEGFKRLVDMIEERKKDNLVLTENLIELKKRIEIVETAMKLISTEQTKLDDNLKLLKSKVIEVPKTEIPKEPLDEIMEQLKKIINSQEKKEDKTLSNLSSGDTKQGGINSQDDTKLQIERSASLPADTHPDDKIILPPEGYCMSCKINKKIENPEEVITKSGKVLIKGECPECKTMLITRK